VAVTRRFKFTLRKIISAGHEEILEMLATPQYISSDSEDYSTDDDEDECDEGKVQDKQLRIPTSFRDRREWKEIVENRAQFLFIARPGRK
jgi:hypothetical protein